MEKGHITIHAQNIMPIIKKWLYSDKDIFLREIVSNGCDAIKKHSILALKGETDSEDAYRVDVTADKAAGTLTVSDNGVGMTAEEIEKYIAQVAFSGAEEFLAQYKPEGDAAGGIIGHFGLGFYSSFMVSKKVVIDTLSWQPGARAVRWSSEDGMEYEIGPSERTARGTSIIMHLSEDEAEFFDPYTLRQTLQKYCAFMSTPIFLSFVEPEADADGDAACQCDHAEGEACQCGDAREEKAPEQINDTDPLWLKRPGEASDEAYLEFYKKVFNDFEKPLFWVHLNAEYPFNLKGILYFPKIKNEFTANEGEVKLYNNQVFVADNIKEIIPEFLLLLKGVVDCPDLPLNVSRSFLQNDGYVKKLSAYITRKVADRLMSEYNTRRDEYQKYWDDIHPFIKYGCIRDEKFYDRVKDALLFKTTEGEYLTVKEYGDKHFDEKNKTVYYASDKDRQAQMIRPYIDQGRDVVVLDTLIDNNFISFMEYSGKNEMSFRRVDAGVEGFAESSETDEADREALEARFREALGDSDLSVTLNTFKSGDMSAMVTVDEQSRRFAEMSRQWGGEFKMPQQRTLALNVEHPIIRYIRAADANDEALPLMMNQVVDLAEMARQPLESERMLAFIKRSNEIMALLAKEP